MRLPKPTIPSSFVRLDTRINEADAFANIYSAQALRKNHNILLARRSRRILFSQIFAHASGAGDFFRFVEPASLVNGQVVLSIPLYFSHRWVREIVVNFEANKESIGDVTLYANVKTASEPRDLSLSVSTVVNNNPALADYSMLVPVSKRARVSGGGTLTIVGNGFIEGVDVDGPATVDEAGPNFVDVPMNPSGGQIGHGLYVTTNGRIQPRQITDIRSDGAASSRIFVDPPWNIIPNPGTDSVAVREAAEVAIRSISVYEEKVTGFSDEATTFIL